MKFKSYKHKLEAHGSSAPSHKAWGLESQLLPSNATLDVAYTLLIPRENSVDLQSPSFEYSKSGELWQGTCFELFVKIGTLYWEWNFLPNGRSHHYFFEDWRKKISSSPGGAVLKTAKPNSIHASIDTAAHPLLQWHLFNHPATSEPIEYQCSCILQSSGEKSYWSIQSNYGKTANFHSPESFLKF